MVKIFYIRAPRWLNAGIYVVMGWLCVGAAGQLLATLPVWVLCLIIGGVTYTLGAVVYMTKIFNFMPGVFGFHEVWHIFVLCRRRAFCRSAGRGVVRVERRKIYYGQHRPQPALPLSRQDNEARRNFLITSLVYFASFIIPILPLIVVMGYTARIMRQVVNGEEPHMTAWDDWESMFKDGLYLFGVRIVYTLPFFLILVPLSSA